MKEATHIVAKKDNGIPLVSFLAQITGSSRKAAKRLLDARRIWVNEKCVWMAKHNLRAGDKVRMGTDTESASALKPIYQDDQVIILNKPAGMLSVGERSVEARLKKAQSARRVYAVHRLDRNTSGCLIFARDTQSRDALVDLFRQHRVTKVYRAVVAGSIDQDQRRVRKPVDDKDAISEFRVLDRNKEASYVTLRIETGRTHQIRRHMAEIGHPLLGDTQYGSQRRKTRAVDSAPLRQMLHAYSLAFRNPITGKSIRCTAPLPPDFGQCLKRHKLS